MQQCCIQYLYNLFFCHKLRWWVPLILSQTFQRILRVSMTWYPCTFSYVRDNYFTYRSYRTIAGSTTPASTVNWVTYVYDRGVENYVPMELIRGAIHCGMNYALYAVSAPSDILQQLHVDFSGIPGVLGLLKFLLRFAIHMNSCHKSLNPIFIYNT